MNELDKKLAKWRWPNTQVYIPRAGGEVRVRIDGQTTQYDLFTQSLDACITWLVPELEPMSIRLDISTSEKSTMAFINSRFGITIGYARAETPALALCKALERLMDIEAKTK